MSLEKQKTCLYIFLAHFVEYQLYMNVKTFIKVMEGIEKAAWLRE